VTVQQDVDAPRVRPQIEMQERRRKRRRGPARVFIENASPFLISALLLVMWQLIVPLTKIPQLILPTPLEILAKIGKSWPLLLSDTQVTLLEVIYGFIAAVAAGIPIALCIFYSRFFAKSIYPILVGLQTIPKVALAPLLVMWFGFGILPKVVISFLIAFFPIVITTVVGLSGLDRQMVYLVQSMGASEFQTFLKVRLPAALPSIFGGFKVAISLSVIGAVIGEYIAAESGLGYRQLTANIQFDSALNFAALICIALCGVVTFAAISGLERLFVRQR
jgi:NitT/TauT family transport system permease protein